jgi:hypothetical protein
MRRLAHAEFVPPESWCEAARGLEVAKDRVVFCRGRSFHSEADAALRNELAAFRAAYWQLPPSERRRCWEQLKVRCEPFALIARQVASLANALDYDVCSIAGLEGRAKLLAEQLLTLSALSPTDRATRRREWLAQVDGTSKEWTAAVSKLQQVAPAIVQFDASLVGELTDRDRVAAARRKPVRVKIKVRREAEAVEAPSGSRLPWFLVFIVVSGLIKIVGLVGSSSSPTRYPPRTTFRQPSSTPRSQPVDRPPDVQTNESDLRPFGVDVGERSKADPAGSGVDSTTPPPNGAQLPKQDAEVLNVLESVLKKSSRD